MTRSLRATLTALAFVASTLGARARAAPPAPASSTSAPAANQGDRDATPGAKALLAGEDPALGATVPDLGDAPGRDLIGKPIRRIEVVTVGGRWPSPLTITRAHPGEAASLEAARRILREALETGRFARANVEAFAEQGGVVLRLNVLPRRLIATIQVRGSALENAETLEAADVAIGGELTAPKLADAAARIRRFYQQHGFPLATVHTDAADTDQPDKVILSIDIAPGKARTIAQRVFVIDPVADREVGDLKSSYKVDAGARADEPSLADADRDLDEVLRQHGFFRVDVRHALLSVGVYTYLYVYVTPGPRLVPSFDGNRTFGVPDLEDALNLAKAPDARPTELIERVRSFYVRRGFLDAEVSMVEKGKPEDPVHYLAFTIREHRQVHVAKRVFPCLTGEMTPDDVGREIGSFLEEELPGSETFTPVDPRAIAKMLGPTEGAGGRGLPPDLNPLRTYAPDTYERAIKHVRDLLHSKGYLNAVVGPVSLVRSTCSKRSPAGTCVPVVPKEKLEARCLTDSLGLPLPEPPVPDAYMCRPDTTRDVECSPDVTVRIPIALGPQTSLYDLAFEGNRSLDSIVLEKKAALPLGAPLSSVELEAARLRVLDAYRRQGFAYAEVRTNAEPSPDRTRARVRFYVTERDRVVVTGFVVKGAVRTHEGLVLRRVALRKDGYYREDLVRQTEERVATLGVFSSVSVSLEDADVPEKRKRVVITVVESDPQYIQAQPGFSTGDGARLSFEWGHKNLGGLAISLALRVQLSYLFQFLILDPAVLQNYYPSDKDCLPPSNKLCSALERLERRNTLSITFPEIGLGPLVSLTLDAIDLRDNQRDYAITKEAIVPTINFRPIRQITTQLGVSTEINDVSIFNEEALAQTFGLLRAPEGRTIALAQRLGFTTDLRDNPLNATRGLFVSTGLEHVNAFPLGAVDNKATIQSHFLRFTGKISGYVPFTQKGLTLAMSVGAGYNLQLASGSKTYPDRLFFMGGVDSIRAFLADSLVPQDVADLIVNKTKNPSTMRAWQITDVALRGGDVAVNARAELRIPLTDLFQTAVFLDTGNVWVDPAQLSFIWRYGLGTGLRLVTPIGLLAFDYGFNLNRRAWEDIGAFHFSIGVL